MLTWTWLSWRLQMLPFWDKLDCRVTWRTPPVQCGDTLFLMFFFSGCFLGLSQWPPRTLTVLALGGILSLFESIERFCVSLKRRKWVKLSLWKSGSSWGNATNQVSAMSPKHPPTHSSSRCLKDAPCSLFKLHHQPPAQTGCQSVFARWAGD